VFRFSPHISILALTLWLLGAAPLSAEEVVAAPPPPPAPSPDSGDTAWMLVSSALVMLMVPGLALFYGGMVRRKNVLATMMHSMVSLSIVGVLWIAVGYALAFGKPILSFSGGSLLGWDPRLVFLQGIEPTTVLPSTRIPVYLHVMFQGMFAIITPALISGALAERIRFKPFCIFVVAWLLIVYCPIAHWVWAMDWWEPIKPDKDAGSQPVGWLGALGALDFAGGTVVHIGAGVSGLAAILVLRKRLGYPGHAIHPNSMVLTLLGTGLLWFGWFGFNGGSGLSSGSLATSAFAATQAAAAAGGLSWTLAEWIHKGKPTALGLASGIVAGLVAVTPASGYVYPWGGLAIGLIAGAFCYGSVLLKPVFGYDDSLDAFGVHGVGGFLGAVLTGVFCFKAVQEGSANGLFAGGASQVGIQFLAAAITSAYAFVVSFGLVKLIDATIGFTTDAASETEGLDQSEHGEAGFDLNPATETTPVDAISTPRAAPVPPKKVPPFVVRVEGAPSEALLDAWSKLCQPATGPTNPDFRAVYPYMTTVSGNRFRFRGGQPPEITTHLRQLFAKELNNQALRVLIEN
jgi:ammonium transporter